MYMSVCLHVYVYGSYVCLGPAEARREHPLLGAGVSGEWEPANVSTEQQTWVLKAMSNSPLPAQPSGRTLDPQPAALEPTLLNGKYVSVVKIKTARNTLYCPVKWLCFFLSFPHL